MSNAILNQVVFTISIYSLPNVGIKDALQKIECTYDEALEFLVLYFSLDDARGLLDEAMECMTPRVRTVSDMCGITIARLEWDQFKQDLH